MGYEQTFRRSVEDPEGFWREAAELISWDAFPETILDTTDPNHPRWFADGTLNTCFNAVDRHVEHRGDQPALVHDSPVTDSVTTLTYRELRDEVAHAAGGLRSLGVEQGDRVIIYMPMVPEAAIAMLACARIGAVHSVVFGGFAPRELAVRIDDAKPKVLIAGSCGIEPSRIVEYLPIVDKALDQAEHTVDTCVVLQRDAHPGELVEGRDVSWAALMADAEPVDCVPVAGDYPLYILYTSGTTGTPKGVLRDNGGHAVALRWSMPNLYDTHPGEVFWAASDVGWVVGHSYIVYAPLLTGCTTVMYEGKPVGTPDAGAFWRVIDDHDVATLFTAPTAFRAIKKEDADGEHLAEHDLSSFRVLYLAGERTDPDTYDWATDLLARPVIDHWWQTETGWPIVCNPLGIEQLEIKPGSAAVPVPGWQVDVLDEHGQQRPTGENGAIAIRLPLPPGALLTVYGDDERYLDEYLSTYDGYYLTGDGGYIDEDGYVFIMGRTDDVINVAGHRLSTGAMEEVVAAHDAVAECAVIGVADDMKGQIPVGFVVLKSGTDVDDGQLRRELVQMVRDEVGPVAAFKDVRVVSKLPKTRSGKILRRTMRRIADGEEYTTPSTIEDATALDVISDAIASR
ncbi:MAG: propionyl-CoA synthetase [Actinobacteria bacterium]|nr:propionyl-CoA synthetase [Actinomycetota bacterium]